MELPKPKYYKLVSKDGEDLSNGKFVVGYHLELWQNPNGDCFIEVDKENISGVVVDFVSLIQ